MRSSLQPTANTLSVYSIPRFPRVPVDAGYHLGCFSRWDIHAIPEVEVAIVKGPVFEGRVGKEGGSIREVGKSTEY